MREGSQLTPQKQKGCAQQDTLELWLCPFFELNCRRRAESGSQTRPSPWLNLLPHRPMEETPVFWHLVGCTEFGYLPISSDFWSRVGPPLGSTCIWSYCTRRQIVLSLQWCQLWQLLNASQSVGPFLIFRRCELLVHYHFEFTCVMEHFSNSYFVILLLWIVRPYAFMGFLFFNQGFGVFYWVSPSTHLGWPGFTHHVYYKSSPTFPCLSKCSLSSS